MFERIKSIIKRMEFRDLCAPLVFLVILIPASVFRLINKMRERALWLIAEDGEARDNGYHFYKYVRENHPTDYCFYAIKPQSAGYEKVAKLGNVIKWGSLKHWLYYMSANLNISSQKSGNPCPIFWYIMHVTLGLYRNRVFLQHGITHNDAKWIYYDKTKFKYFICGTRKEYDFIRKKFGYPDENLALTGFPRWDALKDISKKQKQKSILIMPTWRNWLGGDRNTIFKVDCFEKTNYFIKWNELLNDKKFINYIEKNNIVVYFYPHINMMQFLDSFKTASNNIKIVPSNQNIQDFFNKCDLMITDYSSVAFDFAFLDKPVIYYQFDQEEFRTRQHKEGFFSYERDGFGPVVKNPIDVVKCVEKFLRHECNVYIERIEKYFGDRKESFSSELYNFLAGGRKTILYVIYTLRNCGTEKYLLNNLTHLYDKYNCIVTYYYGDNYFEDEFRQMKIRTFKIIGNNLKRMLALRRIIRHYNVDIVYSLSFFNSVFVGLSALMSGIRTRIVHSHRSAPNRKIGIIKTLPARLLTTFLFTKRLACNEAAGEALFLGHKFEVIGNGIELSNYTFNDENRRILRKKLGLSESEILLGSVGRLDDNKNQIFLLKILKILVRESKDYKLVLFGEGENEKRLRQYAEENNLSDYVIFGGLVKNVNEYYNAMDIFLLTSFSEGLPFVLIEAQANGLPVIASSSIDPKSKLNDNFEFLNLDDGVEHWANEIMNIDKKRQKPSKQIEEYSIEKTVAQIEEIYEG